MTTSNWIAERVVDWLKEKPTKGPKELHADLKKRYSIEIPYDKVLRGKEKALDKIFGKWDDSYDLVPTYRAELLKSLTGSIVEFDTKVSRGCMLQEMFCSS
jgi:hypothetical protein